MRAARPEMTDDELAGFAHRNVVMRSLGSKDELEPDVYVNKVAAGRSLHVVHRRPVGLGARREDRAILQSTDDVEAACQLLVDAANEAGGPDNITVLLVRLADRPRGRTTMIQALVSDNRVLVCVGPGGVGKTTIAAAVGALAARRGKRTLVCTIDPAPRLADALGTGGLGAEPQAAAAGRLPRARDRRRGAASCTRCASTPRRRSSAW